MTPSDFIFNHESKINKISSNHKYFINWIYSFIYCYLVEIFGKYFLILKIARISRRPRKIFGTYANRAYRGAIISPSMMIFIRDFSFQYGSTNTIRSHDLIHQFKWLMTGPTIIYPSCCVEIRNRPRKIKNSQML